MQRQIVGINEQIARNSRLAVDATGNARESLREQNQRLRAERGLLTAQRQRLNLLLPGLRDEIRATREATQSTRRLSGVLNEIGGIVGGIGIAELAFHIQQFATNSVRAAAELQGFERGLQIIEGTNAPQRLEELIAVANLPGLQLAQLINYNNRLRAIGLSAEEVDSILLTTGQTILAMGGTSDIAAQAVEQLVQALQTNTVSLQDFRSIAQRIPGFYQAIAATHGVEASIDGFRVAVDNAGGSVKDALLPVMDELARRFGSPPADSYVVAIDGLQNSFFLLQAEIGNNLLPVIARAATGLSQFFDAIRENDLDELPAPIQAIVSGAQSLYNGLIQVGEAIRRGLGPEIDLLLPAIGTLLGNVLDLAGSLVNALAPAYEILAVPTRVAISLIVHLANTVSSVIDGITSFVDWVNNTSGALLGIEAPATSANQAIQATATATQQAAESTENFQGALQTLQSDLSSVNAQLAQKRQRYEELVSSGANPAHASLQQLDRQIQGLEADSARLTGEINNLTTATQGSTTATEADTPAKEDATEAAKSLSEIYETLTERIQDYSNLQNTLAEQQRQTTDFFRLATGEAEAYGGAIDTVIPSVTDAEKEQQALNEAVQSGIDTTGEIVGDPLSDYVSGLGLTSQAADDATSAITDNSEATRGFTGDIDKANERLRDFQGGVENTKRSHIDFRDVVDRETTPAIEDLTTALDESKQAAEETESAFDALDSVVAEVPDSTGMATDAFLDFETVALRALRDIGDELSAFEGGLGDVGMAVDNLVTLFDNPVNFATGTLGAVIEGLTTLEDFAGPLGLPADFFTDPVPRDTGGVVDPRNIRAAEDQEALQTHTAGIARYLDSPGGAEFLRENAPQLLHRPGTREFVEQNYPELVPILYPRGAGRSNLQQGYSIGGSTLTTSTPESRAADAARQSYFDQGATDYPDVAEIPEAITEAAMDVAEPLLDVFRFTGAQRAELQTLQANIETAENDIRNLSEDSTQEEVIAAYQNLAAAEQAYTNRQLQFIDAGVGIYTDTALQTARDTATRNLTNRAFDANTLLVRALDDIGFQLVNSFSATSGILSGSALAIQRIPEMAEEAAAEVEVEPEAEPLRDVFRFTGEQRTTLNTLRGDVTEAEDTLNRLRRDDTATPFQLIEAYNNLIAAEQALFDQEIEFIDAGVGVFEDSALEAARTQAGQRFRGEIFDANVDLTNGLQNIGLQLTDTITDWFAILTITALDIQAIPDPVVPETPELETPQPTQEPEVLSNVHRFTTAERDVLGGLQNAVDIAQGVVDRLNEDSTQEEIAAAYTDLATAEQALFNQQIAFINSATGITETARENARTLATQRFEGEILDANQDLVGALEAVGLQLTTTITDWFGILTGAQLAVQAIPDPVVPEPEAEPEELRDVFRFTGAQRERLGVLENEVRAAEDAIGLLNEESTEAEVTAAYTRLANAEQALFNQKVAFINNATGITEDARMTALELAGGEFGRELFDANVRLVGALEDIGLELITMFDATTGILTGTALATQQIVSEVEDAGETQERGIGNNLLENAIARARFNLTGATTEQEFEAARQALIRAINEYYDAEETRINMLMLSEDELQDLREDNDLRRDQALRRATTATNTFAEDRIRTEEQFAEERIRTEERIQDEIEDLRDDALENERDRQEDLVELYEDAANRRVEIERDTQREIEDILRGTSRLQEDLRRDFGQDLADTLRESGFSEEEISQLVQEATSGLAQGFGIDVVQSNLERRTGIALGGDIRSQIGDLALGYRRDLSGINLRGTRRLQDTAIDQSRDIGDLDRGTTTSAAEIQRQADATATAIGTALTPLLAMQQEPSTVQLMAENAVIESPTATFAEAPVIPAVSAPGPSLQDRMMIAGAGPPAGFSAGSVSITAQSVSVSGATLVGDGDAVEVNVDVQPQDVVLDGEKVGQAVGNTITRQGANRRNLLGSS